MDTPKLDLVKKLHWVMTMSYYEILREWRMGRILFYVWEAASAQKIGTFCFDKISEIYRLSDLKEDSTESFSILGSLLDNFRAGFVAQ